MGNDDKIEKPGGEEARIAYENMNRVKIDIENQTKLNEVL